MEHSQEIDKIVAALIAAEEEFDTIEKNADANVGRPIKYADLREVYDSTKKALRKHGLKCVGGFSAKQEGAITLETMLFHISGQWMKSTLSFKPESGKPTDMGKLITYMRRYSYITLLGITPEEKDDKDGNELNDSVSPQERPSVKATSAQLARLKTRLEEENIATEKVLNAFGLFSLEELTAEQFQKSMKRLDAGKK